MIIPKMILDINTPSWIFPVLCLCLFSYLIYHVLTCCICYDSVIKLLKVLLQRIRFV